MPAVTASDAAYAAMTEGCAVLAPADDGKLAITGADAREFLTGQVSNDIAGLADGHGCYAALLTNKGKMLADLRVLAVPATEDTPAELLLLTERATLQTLFDTLRRAIIGWDAELHKRTLELDRIVLVGPGARELAGVLPAGAAEHDLARGAVGGRRVLAVATATGAELLVAADDGDAVRAALAGAGAVAADPAAAEVVRVELGRPRYGAELDDSVIPQEAGLNDRAVSFTKGCYVGQETVARLFYKGKPNRHLRGLRLESPAAPGDVVTHDGREVGRVGTAVVSPVHGPIALAILRREVEPGAIVAVGATAATVVTLPF